MPLSCDAAPVPSRLLALGRRKARQEIVEALVATIVPVKLAILAHQQPGRTQLLQFLVSRKQDVQ